MKYILLLFITFWSYYLQAQDKTWTLGECIDYALQHHPKIVDAQRDIQTARYDVKQKRYDFLPELSISANQGYNLGSSFNVSTGVGQKESSFFSAGFNAQLDIFDGLVKHYRLQQSKWQKESYKMALENQKLELTMTVIKNFLSVLSDQAMIDELQSEWETYQQQLHTLKKLFDKQLKPQSELTQIQIETQNVKIQWQNALKQYKNDLLTLASNMNFSGSIQAVRDDLPLMPVATDTIVQWERHPGIKMLHNRLASEKSNLKVIKSNFYPKLTLNYSLHSNYYHILGQPDVVFNQTTNTLEPYDFSAQIQSNLIHYIGLSLQIPIFQKYRNRLNIIKKQSDIKQLENKIAWQKNQLSKTYRQIQNEVSTSQTNLKLMTKNIKLLENQLKKNDELWQKSLLSIFDFLQTKRQYSSMKLKYLQAKYATRYKQYILQKILEKVR